jgi:hypothetical protein
MDLNVKSVKTETYARKILNYKFKDVDNINDLTEKTYTFLKKPTTVKGTGKLQRGDVVVAGLRGKQYGLKLEKFLSLYNLGNATNKPVTRKGFRLTRKNLDKLKVKGNNLKIMASWGSEQEMKQDDYIVLENDGKGYYGVSNGTFKKSYKK